MARTPREMGTEGSDELDLAPFMNMVVILIPMLLLSVVFVKIGVINITAPKLSIGPKKEQKEDPEEKLNLTVAISAKGFRIAAKDANLQPIDGCPSPGPTICLEKDSVDVAAKFDAARTAFENENAAAGNKALSKGLSAYNFRALYNRLVEIKQQYSEETIIKLAADGNIPFAVLVRVMDVARYKLGKKAYSKTSAFWEADYKKKGNKYVPLFNSPVLTVAQTS